MTGKIAVVLFNLGGPDSIAAVRPFLFNLFNDPAIIRQPAPLRWLLARLISRKRAPVAREIYRRMGGKSPILDNTVAQANALTAEIGGESLRVFVCMRYWHPMTDEVVAAVKAFGPEKIVLLPLYPQFSTSTTGSSVETWRRESARAGLDAPTTLVCCYPDETGFVTSVARLTREAWAKASESGRPRVLFSAHGLPKKFVDDGDPYAEQIGRTVAAAVAAMDIDALDYVICYQSRVGRIEWLKPYTDAEIERAGDDGVPVIVVPVAFVSEHSETLVELDIEYAELARRSGVPAYIRVPVAATETEFIRGLAALVREAIAEPGAVRSSSGGRLCPLAFSACAQAGALGSERARG